MFCLRRARDGLVGRIGRVRVVGMVTGQKRMRHRGGEELLRRVGMERWDGMGRASMVEQAVVEWSRCVSVEKKGEVVKDNGSIERLVLHILQRGKLCILEDVDGGLKNSSFSCTGTDPPSLATLRLVNRYLLPFGKSDRSYEIDLDGELKDLKEKYMQRKGTQPARLPLLAGMVDVLWECLHDGKWKGAYDLQWAYCEWFSLCEKELKRKTSLSMLGAKSKLSLYNKNLKKLADTDNQNEPEREEDGQDYCSAFLRPNVRDGYRMRALEVLQKGGHHLDQLDQIQREVGGSGDVFEQALNEGRDGVVKQSCYFIEALVYNRCRGGAIYSFLDLERDMTDVVTEGWCSLHSLIHYGDYLDMYVHANLARARRLLGKLSGKRSCDFEVIAWHSDDFPTQGETGEQKSVALEVCKLLENAIRFSHIMSFVAHEELYTAQTLLARCYLEGMHPEKNHIDALRLFCTARPYTKRYVDYSKKRVLLYPMDDLANILSGIVKYPIGLVDELYSNSIKRTFLHTFFLIYSKQENSIDKQREFIDCIQSIEYANDPCSELELYHHLLPSFDCRFVTGMGLEKTVDTRAVFKPEASLLEIAYSLDNGPFDSYLSKLPKEERRHALKNIKYCLHLLSLFGVHLSEGLPRVHSECLVLPGIFEDEEEGQEKGAEVVHTRSAKAHSKYIRTICRFIGNLPFILSYTFKKTSDVGVEKVE
eukprot:Nk52_evm9s158 gene=Nk52_evmTU9s158